MVSPELRKIKYGVPGTLVSPELWCPRNSVLTACLNEVAESADFSDNAAPIRRCRDWSNAVLLTHPFFEPLRRRIMGILLGFFLNRRYNERTVSISGDDSQRMPG